MTSAGHDQFCLKGLNKGGRPGLCYETENGKSPFQLIKMSMAFRGIFRYLSVNCSECHEVAACCNHGYYIQILIIESENGLGQKGPLNSIQSNPPAMSSDIFS